MTAHSKSVFAKMYGATPLQASINLEAVLDEFDRSEALAPERSSLSERTSQPYTRKVLLEFAKRFRSYERSARNAPSEMPLNTALILRRNRAPKYEALLNLGSDPRISIQGAPSIAHRHYPGFFELADRVAARFRPDWATVHIADVAVEKLETSNARVAATTMLACARTPHYYWYGPAGLAMRTYIGPHFVDQIGANLLTSLPAQVEKLDWGGYRIDLLNRVWETSLEAQIAVWVQARDLLAQTGVMAMPMIRDDGAVVWRTGPNCIIGGVIERPGDSLLHSVRVARMFERWAQDLDFSGQALSVTWTNARLRRVTAHGTIFTQTILAGATIVDSDWTDVNLSGQALDAVKFENCDLSRAQLDRTRLRGAALVQTCCDRARFSDAVLDEACLDGSTFVQADLRGASLVGARGRDVSFRSADLRGANFSGSDFGGVDFEGASMDGVTWDNAELDSARFGEGKRAT